MCLENHKAGEAGTKTNAEAERERERDRQRAWLQIRIEQAILHARFSPPKTAKQVSKMPSAPSAKISKLFTDKSIKV